MSNGLLSGFSLGLDYALNWMEVVSPVGTGEDAWVAFVRQYNELVGDITRPAPAGEEPLVFFLSSARKRPMSIVDSQQSWTLRMIDDQAVCDLLSCRGCSSTYPV